MQTTVIVYSSEFISYTVLPFPENFNEQKKSLIIANNLLLEVLAQTL